MARFKVQSFNDKIIVGFVEPIKVSFKFQFKRLEVGKNPSITAMSAQTKSWNFFQQKIPHQLRILTKC